MITGEITFVVLKYKKDLTLSTARCYYLLSSFYALFNLDIFP